MATYILTIHIQGEIICLTEDDRNRMYAFMVAWKHDSRAYYMRLTVNGKQIHIARRKDATTWENFRYQWRR